MKLIFIFLLTTFINNLAFAEGNKIDVVDRLKKGGAVTAFTKEDGFKLSKKAVKKLEIKFKSLKGNGPWRIPKSSLVRIKHSTGVYRKWDGWITMVLVKVIEQSEDSVTIKSVDLQHSDQVATGGVAFLRMTEADLNSDTVDSCSH